MQFRSPASPVCLMRIYAWVQSHYDRSCWWDVLNIAHTKGCYKKDIMLSLFDKIRQMFLETFNSTSI